MIAAIHDAGHAVAMVVLGFSDFVVDLDADEAVASFTLTATPPSRHPQAARGVAIAAGPAAEVCYRRLRRVRPIGGRSLQDELAKLGDDAVEVDVDDLHTIAGGRLDHHFQMLANVAQALLLRRWAAVEAVAEALRRRRRLSGEDVAAVMAGGTATLGHVEPDRTDRVAATMAQRARTPRRRAAASP